MEHENGSDREPAAPSPPDQLSSLEPCEPAEPREPVEDTERAETERADLEESPERLQATGEPRVDAALGRLGELDELPVSEHPGVYERVHEQLVDVLGELHQGTQNQ